jgi:hypothetical protein
MEPAPGGTETPPDASPPSPPGTSLDRKKWAVIGSLVVIAVVVAAVSLPGLLVQPPQEGALPVASPPPATTFVPPDHRAPGVPVPPSPVASPSATATQTPIGPPGFTVTVSPVQASAARGETVIYHMTIEAQNGFSENVSMKLTASVLFILSNTYDLGTQEPPYPKTFEYALKVPDTLIPGTTVNGVLTSTGGGITRENQITLHVQ